MSVTPEFGWPLIEPTDFVTNLPADFEAFADAVDDDLKDLKGGSTGQVLTKDSATDLDFSWQAVVSGGMTSLATGTLSGAQVDLTSISSGYKDLVLILRDWAFTGTGVQFQFRLNNNSSTIYLNVVNSFAVGYSYTTNTINANKGYLTFGNAPAGDKNAFVVLRLTDYADTSHNKTFEALNIGEDSSSNKVIYRTMGQFADTAAISEINLSATEFGSGTTFSGGTYVLYGVN